MTTRPEIVDDVVEFEGGMRLVRRMASYPDGRREIWVEPWCGEPEDGCRVRSEHADIGIAVIEGGCLRVPLTQGGEMFLPVPDNGLRKLPDAIMATVLYRNGLFDAVDVTEAVAALDFDALRAIRDGDPSAIPFSLPETVVEVDLCASISWYFGHPPDFDEFGAAVSSALAQADVIQTSACRDFAPRPSP